MTLYEVFLIFCGFVTAFAVQAIARNMVIATAIFFTLIFFGRLLGVVQ
nr:MAG TPA: hypothetical protein [Caudoviricetes sp.]